MPPKSQKGGGARPGERERGHGGGKKGSSPKGTPVGGSKPVAKSTTASTSAAKPPISAVPPAAAKKKGLESLPAMPSITDPNNLALLGPLELQIRQELSSLDEHLASLGKVRLMVAKDGACLFRSMAQALFGIQGLHLKVRSACVEHLLAREEDYVFFIDIKCDMSDSDEVHKEYLTYTEKLRGETAWGGQLEIQALSQCYRRNFTIYQALPLVYGTKKDEMSEDKAQKERTHEIVTTEISNGFEETVYLAYSHGNHYDVVFDIDYFLKIAYMQKLVHHTIDTLFQRPEERQAYFLRDLAFERTPEVPLTHQQILEGYDNRQWKQWQSKLQKEKSTDETIARRMIAEESGTADASSWHTVGATKKKGTGKKGGQSSPLDALTQAQIARMEELSSHRSSFERDALLAASLEDELKAPLVKSDLNDDEMAAIRRMEEDERLARELSDEQYALQLSQELNPGLASNPKVQHFPDNSLTGAKTTSSTVSSSSSTSRPTTGSSSSPATGSSKSFSSASQKRDSGTDAGLEDGFLPSGKKARQLALRKQAEQEERAKALAMQKAKKEQEEAQRKEQQRKDEQRVKENAVAKASVTTPTGSTSANSTGAPNTTLTTNWSAIASPGAKKSGSTAMAGTSPSSSSQPATVTRSPDTSTTIYPSSTPSAKTISSKPATSSPAPTTPSDAPNMATSPTRQTSSMPSTPQNLAQSTHSATGAVSSPTNPSTIPAPVPRTNKDRGSRKDPRSANNPGGVGRGRNLKTNTEHVYVKRISDPVSTGSTSEPSAPVTLEPSSATSVTANSPDFLEATSPTAPAEFSQMDQQMPFGSPPFMPSSSPDSSMPSSMNVLHQPPLHLNNRLDSPSHQALPYMYAPSMLTPEQQHQQWLYYEHCRQQQYMAQMFGTGSMSPQMPQIGPHFGAYSSPNVQSSQPFMPYQQQFQQPKTPQ
jgi:hypothetical protein